MVGQLTANRARMRTLATAFPEHLARGFQFGRDAEATTPREARRAIVVGMGGSGIASDLLDGVLRPELGWELTTLRGPSLVGLPPDPPPVVVVSYSGNTWEALSAYDAARRRRAQTITVGSGGELERRARRDGVAHVSLPPGLPPRGALGLVFGALLGILAPTLPGGYARRFSAVLGRLRQRQPGFSSPRGRPARLAALVGARTPTVIVGTLDLPIARRWQAEVEENAKRPAHVELFPEVMHNALAAWDAMPRTEGRRHAAIFLTTPAVREPVGIAAGRTYLSKVLAGRAFRVGEVGLPYRDRLEAVLTAVSFGDHFSLHLAERTGTDPLEVRALERGKEAVEVP